MASKSKATIAGVGYLAVFIDQAKKDKELELENTRLKKTENSFDSFYLAAKSAIRPSDILFIVLNPDGYLDRSAQSPFKPPTWVSSQRREITLAVNELDYSNIVLFWRSLIRLKYA